MGDAPFPLAKKLLWLGGTISFAMNSESERKLRIPGNRTQLPLAHCSVRKWIKERLQAWHWALVAAGIAPSAALLLGLVGCTYSPTGYAQQTRDLIIVAGQSNAVGFSSNVENFTAHAADRNILSGGEPEIRRPTATSAQRRSLVTSTSLSLAVNPTDVVTIGSSAILLIASVGLGRK